MSEIVIFWLVIFITGLLVHIFIGAVVDFRKTKSSRCRAPYVVSLVCFMVALYGLAATFSSGMALAAIVATLYAVGQLMHVTFRSQK
jgi:hypothetical protein